MTGRQSPAETGTRCGHLFRLAEMRYDLTHFCFYELVQNGGGYTLDAPTVAADAKYYALMIYTQICPPLFIAPIVGFERIKNPPNVVLDFE